MTTMVRRGIPRASGRTRMSGGVVSTAITAARAPGALSAGDGEGARGPSRFSRERGTRGFSFASGGSVGR